VTRVELLYARVAPTERTRWLESAIPLLAPSELDRVAAIPDLGVRTQYALGRALLRLLASRTVDHPVEQIEITTSESGKPSLVAFPTVGVSIAHGGEMVIVATCSDAPVGVDVEAPVPAGSRHRRIVDRTFAASEAAVFRTLDGEPASHWFARAWTTKEAVGKALDAGLIPALAGAEVNSDADALTSVWAGPPAEDWTLHQLRPPASDEWVSVAIPLAGVSLGAVEQLAMETVTAALSRPAAH
jgi:phosphopantetheinyl transferase